MQIGAILALLEGIAPPELADEDDRERIGLLVEGGEEVRNVCCCVDVTPKVVQQAILRRSTFLVAHHNPFHDSLSVIRGYDADLIRGLLIANMNLYVMHTNFDRAPEGVNWTLAHLLGLNQVIEMPMGVIGTCTLSLQEIGERLNGPLRIYGEIEESHTLAIVGGSGFQPNLIEFAHRNGADAFLSSELKHHVALRSSLPLLESTHYDLEAPAMRRLAENHSWFFMETRLSCRNLR